MAFCANCGKEISDRAPICPNCGHPQQGPAQVAAGAGRKTDGNAIASLILGIASFVVCPLVPAIIAVILGNKARESIRQDPSLEGDSMAKAGVILGWVNIGIVVLVAVLLILTVFLGAKTTVSTTITETVGPIPG